MANAPRTSWNDGIARSCILALLAVVLTAPTCGPVAHRVVLGNLVLRYRQVSATRISGAVWEVTFDASLLNTGPAPVGGSVEPAS